MVSPGDQPHQKVRLLKEYNRDRLYKEVLDDDPAVIDLYAEMEAVERRPPGDLKATLEYMKQKGKSLSVVSEVSGIKGTLTVSASLRAHHLLGLFDEIITPAGRFTPEGRLLDEDAFAGSSKKDGTIYERLGHYLDSEGIHAGQRAMVGADPKLDVEFAKKCGFVAIQYAGVIDRGRTEDADYWLTSWSELPGLL
jgi:FMN phosphatase YigB (HAD superfamily)